MVYSDETIISEIVCENSDMEQTDKQLLENYRKGDHAAFCELFERFEVILISYIWAKCRNIELAKDICQEAFLKLATQPPKFLFGRSLKPWLLKVASNLLADHWRNLSPDTSSHDELPEVAVPAEFINDIEMTERDQAIWHAIMALPEKYRQVLILRFYSDCNHRQIAKALNIPLGTALWQVKKAIELLETELKEIEEGR